MLDQIHQLCLRYFLCKFDPRSKKRKIENVIREIALPTYSPEKVEEFIEDRLALFQNNLVDEFNVRHSNKSPLRFQIADTLGVGSWVEGYKGPKSSRELAFQDALHAIKPEEFEKLAAVILRVLGCREVFFTPQSHDQGVDAFGYQDLITPTPYGIAHSVTWIAQAKHYESTSVSSGDVRELVGSKELLIARVFSTVDERYRQLTLRPYSPIAIALITTEEVPSTVRRLAEGAGIFVFAASDLFQILGRRKGSNTAAAIRRLIKKHAKSISTLT